MCYNSRLPCSIRPPPGAGRLADESWARKRSSRSPSNARPMRPGARPVVRGHLPDGALVACAQPRQTFHSRHWCLWRGMRAGSPPATHSTLFYPVLTRLAPPEDWRRDAGREDAPSGFSAIASRKLCAKSPPFPQVATNVYSVEKFLATARLGNWPFALLTTVTHLWTIRSVPGYLHLECYCRGWLSFSVLLDYVF